jgi:hypothetical protein
VLPFATQHLRYLTTQTQVQKVQSTLFRSLQRTLRCYTVHDIIMQAFGISPLKLQQAPQHVSVHFRYSVTHTHLPAAHLYHLRRARMCDLSHPQNSIESRIKEASATNSDSQILTLDPPPFPPQCSEHINETTASLTLLGSNPRSTTDGTSSSALQSQHMLVQLITQTYSSPHVHKHIIESDFTPPKPTYSNFPIT